MNCIKCGRELRGELVFCGQCKDEMEKYPIKPGTPIHLPVRPEVPEVKKKHREKKKLSPGARIRRLRTSVRLLIIALIVALLAFILTAFLALHLLEQRDHQNQIDQNYHTVTQDGE